MVTKEIFTIRVLLDKAKKRLAGVSESASLDSQLLLGHTLGVERAYLFAHPEQPVRAEHREQFETLLDRAASGEPLPYILGKRAFFDREFVVTPAVLIPRPETELLLEQALIFSGKHRALAVADVGTGSGALAVTLAAHCPAAAIHAIDISPDALNVARHNATIHHVNVTFWEGDLLQPAIDHKLKLDLVLANLPYIPSGELPGLAVSRYEPRLALDGGADGLDLVRRLLAQAMTITQPRALLLLEIGAGQGAAAMSIARAAFPGAAIAVLPDYAGHDRILRIELAGK